METLKSTSEADSTHAKLRAEAAVKGLALGVHPVMAGKAFDVAGSDWDKVPVGALATAVRTGEDPSNFSPDGETRRDPNPYAEDSGDLESVTDSVTV